MVKHSIGERKVLKPTEFQEFELKEKTILSHNTAMYVPILFSSPKYKDRNSDLFPIVTVSSSPTRPTS